MNGIMVRGLGLAVAVLATAGGSGCMGGARYHEVVDPCWPQRYNAVARSETIAFFAPQVQNGHVLDQTVWNYHFEPGEAKLTPGGMAKLDYLSRRRPQPDPRVFLQTARDIPYEGDAPNDFVDQRQDLDARRIQSVQHYLSAQTAARPMPFEVLVHDPAPVGVSGREAGSYLIQNQAGVVGTTGFGAGLIGVGGGTVGSGALTTGAGVRPGGPGGPGGPGAGGF